MEEVAPVLEEKERSASYKPVFVTEITDDLHFYVQDVETGERTGAAPHGCCHDLARLRAPLLSGREGHSPGHSPAAAAHLPGPRSFYQLQVSRSPGEAE